MSGPSAVIVFGAGASFGSGEVAPNPPPIGTDLFPVLRRLFPGAWGALSAEHIAELQGDFEVGMQRIGRENSHALPPLQRAMASFFFDFVPGERNLYRQIAREIKSTSWDGAFVTLNYERLLELSLLIEGVRPVIGSPPSSGPSVELCLPHGCCHIFCESVRGGATGVSFSGTNVQTQGMVKIVSTPSEFAQRIRTDAFPPVMSYFDPLKHTTSCVNFIESQRARYTELVKNAKVIVIVGVRVRPHDAHLWSALGETDGDIVYCAGKHAAEEMEQWVSKVRPHKVNVTLSGYFADMFDKICRYAGL